MPINPSYRAELAVTLPTGCAQSQVIAPASHSVLRTRAKMTLTDDNRVCLLVAHQNQCAPLTQPTLTNGDVTLQLGQFHSTLLGNTRTVTWPVLLSPTFPSGNFTLVATANDADPFPYLIRGTPRSIDLLPWKSLSLPVTVQ